ncbi:MAG: hypothetical protein ABJF04_05650 [Reichenbachiella sp.]|uniref:hypothetical protein n=1 Tax=Reichenbachiella sp. TaxID=2184521 RepID=UPI003262FA18
MNQTCKILIISSCLWLQVATAYGQDSAYTLFDDNEIQWGLGLRLQANFNPKYDKRADFRMSVSFGLSRKIGDYLMPSYQLSATVYKGGLGSSISWFERNKLQFDLVNNFTLTGGYKHDKEWKELITFNTLTANPLLNPFRYSLSMGTNLIYNPNRKDKFQYIGFMAGSVYEFQLLYYNDGPIFNGIGLGDGYDRYWTGGAHFYYGYVTSDIRFNLGFDKFTGYSRDAYELSTLLGLDYVSYKDEMQNTFNTGAWRLEVIEKGGFGVSVTYKDQYDIQHMIHKKGNYAYHPSMLKPHFLYGILYTNRHLF